MPAPDNPLPPAATPEEAKPGQPLVKMNNQGSPVNIDDEGSGTNMQRSVAENKSATEDESKTSGKESSGKDDDPKETFWDKNKKWIKPVGHWCGCNNAAVLLGIRQ